jgi:DNA-directed RNA polymerase specialized sigma24 family protein
MDAGSPSAAPALPDDAVTFGARANALLLRRGYEDGRAEYGDLGIDFPTFAERAVRLAARRTLSLGLAATPERLAEALARAGLSDLALTTACEAGDPAAWRVLSARFVPRLCGLAARRGAAPAEAEAFAIDLVGDLSLPPRSGGTRTLLGTFDGAGSLFAWLAVILVRRMATAARVVRPLSLDAGRAGYAGSAPRATRDGTAADPSEASADAETGDRFGGALEAAWRGMTARERLALLCKYRDGLSQRGIAALLHVGEPRASRLVAQALRKVARAVRAHLGDAPAASDCPAGGAWRALREATAERMARFPVEDALPRERSSRGGQVVGGGQTDGSS